MNSAPVEWLHMPLLNRLGQFDFGIVSVGDRAELETPMRIATQCRALGAAAVFVLTLTGCSGSAALAPRPELSQFAGRLHQDQVPFAFDRLGLRGVLSAPRHQIIGHFNCPPNGPLEYVSDHTYNVIDIYAGDFAGQVPCGQITAGIVMPFGIFLKKDTHDLYVCNGTPFFGFNVLVFRRGQITPYNGYTEPSLNSTADVTVADDGTVFVSNSGQLGHSGLGSISTWIGSPTGGTFIGNFGMRDNGEGSYITVQKNDTVFYVDYDRPGNAILWSVSCPAGHCANNQTQLSGGMMFGKYIGGIKVDSTDDLLLNDPNALTADTFELPNRTPTTFPLSGDPNGLAVDEIHHHWFVTDPTNDNAAEYLYPSGVLIGTVTAYPRGTMIDIAVDPGSTR